MTLYEIDKKIMESIEQSLDPDTGEIVDAEAYRALDDLAMLRDEKLEGLLLWYKNLNAEAEALKKEKQAFEQRQKWAENKAASIKRYVAAALAGEKFKTERVSVSYRSSESVEYTGSIYALPKECIRRKDPEINKEVLKKLLKDGKEIPGAALVKKQNIQIR